MIENLQIGEAVEHRGIVIAPLFPRQDPVAEYITLDEALGGSLRIREVDESGSVPELVVENPLDARVLLYDGEELVGAKQNRILNVSVLVEAKTSLRIPVSCVEQGRWSRRSAQFSASGHISHAHLRRRKAEAQAARPLARGVAQGEVWDAVHEKAVLMSVDSPTDAASDIHRAYAREVRALEDAFPASRASAGRSSGSGRSSASTSSHGPRPSRSCGRSSAPATCSTRSSGSMAPRHRSRRSMPSRLPSAERSSRGSRPRAWARTCACGASA